MESILRQTPLELTETDAVRALAALAQAQRLRAFRALVVAGPEGLTPSTIAEQLALAPSALSFHLNELSHSNLVSREARGRNLIYRANFDLMQNLLAYMTEHCCLGLARTAADAASTCCAGPTASLSPSESTV